jgi:hypothetical protein
LLAVAVLHTLNETRLDEAGIIPCYYQLAVSAYASTACNVLKSGNCFGYFLGPRGINLDSSGSSDSISVWPGWRKVDRSDWSVFLDKNRVLELSPIPRLGISD